MTRHIVYLITDSGVGGTEKILAALIRGLDRKRFSPSLICLKPLGEMARSLAAEGIPVESLGLPAEISLGYLLRLPGAFYRLCRVLRRRPPDALHCFLFQANLLGRFAAWWLGLPANLSSLRVIEAQRRFQLPLDRLTSGLVTRYTAVGEAVRRFAIKEIGIEPERVVNIPNGIDLAPFAGADDRSARDEWKLPPGVPVLGTVGRLHHQKGIDFFLSALARLAETSADFRAVIVGDGPERESLQSEAAALGLEGKVVWAGLRPDTPRLLAAFDLFVLSSRWEGMPNAVLEAMAAGRAVIAADVGAVRELVADGRTGLLVPPGQVDALAEAIGRLLADPARREAMGRAGRVRVEAEFSLGQMVRRTEELYDDVRDLR